MLLHTNHQSDTKLLPMLIANNSSAWSQLYDKYSPLMYGTILNITGDVNAACDILEEAFIQLKRDNVLSKISTTLPHGLLNHTYQVISKYMKTHNLRTTIANS